MEIQPTAGTLYEPFHATAGVSNYVHDVIQVMSEKLDAVWRYDKYIQDCQDERCKQVFRQCKEDDLRHVKMLRDEIVDLCRQGKFS